MGEGKLAAPNTCPLWQRVLEVEPEIVQHFTHREFSQAIRAIMALADEANSFISEQAPWKIAKEEDNIEKAWQVCSQALQVFYAISIMLQPIMPQLC